MSRNLVRRFVVPVVILVAAGALGACGSSPELGAACDSEGKGSQTGDGQDVMCEPGTDGVLVWTLSGPGSRAGQVNREMWDFDSQSCPEAIVDTGYERLIIDAAVMYGSDPGTADRISGECPDAVSNGRTKDYELSMNGVDYVTQLENAGAKISTLNDHFSEGKCEERKVDIKNSFATSADLVEMIWPLGMVSYKHIIPTDHFYVQWKNMTPASNEVLVPADGYVVDIEGVGDDFRVVIELSCNEYIAYGHVDAFAGPIADFASQLGQDHQRILTRIPVKAGDVVALGGEVMTDVWYWDQNETLQGVRVANYILHNGMNIYAVDPFRYLTDPVSAEIAKKVVGEAVTTRGKIGWNESGTAQGGWYQLNTLGERGPTGSWLDHIDLYSTNLFGPWDGSLSWTPDGLDPQTWLFAVGRFNDRGSVIGITRDNRSPKDVTPGSGPVVLELFDFDYESESGEFFSRDDHTKRKFANRLKAIPNGEKLGVVVVEMVDENTLRVEKRPGSNAAVTPTFTGEVITYVR